MPRTSGTRLGNGAGRGGPAKGFVPSPPAPFTADSETRQTETVAHLENGDAVEQVYRAKRRAERRAQKEIDEETAQDLRDHLRDMALRADTHANQIAASREWLNRHEGLPIARNINVSVDELSQLTDAELDAEIARLAAEPGASGSAAEGETPEGCT